MGSFYNNVDSTFVPCVPLVLMESTLGFGFLRYKTASERQLGEPY